MNPILVYLKSRIGEPTSIAAIAGSIAATVAFVFGKIDFATYGTALTGTVTLFLMKQAPTAVQGASAITSEPTPPVNVTAGNSTSK